LPFLLHHNVMRISLVCLENFPVLIWVNIHYYPTTPSHQTHGFPRSTYWASGKMLIE
jgi:hypothetical protein